VTRDWGGGSEAWNVSITLTARWQRPPWGKGLGLRPVKVRQRLAGWAT